MSTRRKLQLALVGAMLVAANARTARADERSDARRHFRTGMDLIGQQRFADGIAELEAAYAILPHPNVLYNIARAYNDMGNTERAIEYLRRYLQNDVADRADVEAIVARLEARLRQPGAAPTVATGTTPGTSTGATPTTGTSSGGPSNTITLPAPTGNAQDYRNLAQAMVRLADAMQGTTPTAPGNVTPTQTATTPRTPLPGTATPALGGTARGDEEYQEQVVTASRAAQSPLDAPNATGVITAQDIRLSGLTNIPDLLRRLVGMDVMELDSSDVQVSTRGFNQRLSNKMLVLVDGRSVYLDFMGVTLWNAVPVSVEDIERIEVIRGPGSALYGADAFTGVVNIITRTPGENRTQVAVGAGTGETFRGSFFRSGREGNLSYRASASYEQHATYGVPISPTDHTYQLTAPDPQIGSRAPRISIDLRGRISRDVTVRGGMNLSAPTSWFNAIGPLRTFWSQLLFVQPYLQIDAGDFTARVFYNRFHADAEPLLNQIGRDTQTARVEQDVVDVDAQYSLRFHIGPFLNTLQVGAGYRAKHISWNYLDGDHLIHHGSLYLQDTLRNQWFSAVASVRGDVDGALDAPVVSPRLSLIAHPSAGRAIRLTGGTAFRTPTMLELYLDFNNQTPVPGVTVASYGGEVAHGLFGTPRLQPENAISADIGYRDQSNEHLDVEVNAFFTRGTNLIQLGNVTLDQLPGTPSYGGQVAVGTGGFINDPAATYIYGGEAGVRIAPVEGLDFYANYTLSLTQHDSNALLNGGNGLPADQRTPIHKLNVGAQLRTRFGLDLEVFGHFVSSQVWLEQVSDVVQGVRYQAFTIPDYFLLNARAGYRLLNDHLDVGIVGTDLTDVRDGGGHVEHPFGNRLSLRVMATAAYRF